MNDHLTATSRFLSYVLRHRPDAIDVHLDEGGWLPIDDLLAAAARHGRPLTRQLLDQVVAGTDKKRFEIDGDRIRAAHGHSIPVQLQLPPATPPPVLYHGTIKRSLAHIRAEGLQPRSRTHVHLSADPQTAAIVAARRGQPVVLTIDAAGMHRHGFTFYQATNGVWLTSQVPSRWLATTEPALPRHDGHPR